METIKEVKQEHTPIYGIGWYSWDGGGSNSDLYSNIEDARKALLKKVTENQDEDNSVYADDPDEQAPKWNEISPDVWSNGMVTVSIDKFNLQGYDSILKENESLKAELENIKFLLEESQVTASYYKREYLSLSDSLKKERDELKAEVERLKELLSQTEAVELKTACILKTQTIEELKSQLSSQKAINKEMVELLKGLISLSPLIEYSGEVSPEHEGEAMAINCMISKAKSLISKHDNK